MRFLILIASALSLLAACASLSEDQCKAESWQEIGQNDGARGRASDFLQNHAKACSEYGIRPNARAWERGRQTGLQSYCTPRNAYREGARGHRLSPVCLPDDLRTLTRANERGLDYYDIEREIAETEHDIRMVRHALAELAEDNPARPRLQAELNILSLRFLRLRAERSRLMY